MQEEEVSQVVFSLPEVFQLSIMMTGFQEKKKSFSLAYVLTLESMERISVVFTLESQSKLFAVCEIQVLSVVLFTDSRAGVMYANIGQDDPKFSLLI